MLRSVNVENTAVHSSTVSDISISAGIFQAQSGAAESALSSPAASFIKDLSIGQKGKAVKILQQFLNKNGFLVADKGPGSLGNETEYFGRLTFNALADFQEAHKDDIENLGGGKGRLGSATRNFIDSLIEKSTGTTEKISVSSSWPSAVFNYYLKNGAASNDVRRLQILLATKPDIYPEGRVTGFFGPLTEKAVQRFQLKYAVVSSKFDHGFGAVGPKTRAKLKEVFGDVQ